jgi:CRISPR-associated protein Cas1
MKHIVVSEFGTFLGLKGERLVVYQSEKVLKEYPLNRLSTITVCKSGVSFSSNLLINCAYRGIKLFVIDENSRLLVALSGGQLHGVVKVRQDQFHFLRTDNIKELSTRIIIAKIKNQRAVLLYYRKYLSKKDDSNSKLFLSKIDKASIMMMEILISLKSADLTHTTDWRQVIMGYEGIAANNYWKCLIESQYFPSSFKGRSGRGATDVVNQMLNYGYGILSTYIWHCALNTGLEIYAGFLHTQRAGKPSLILDLMEEYRPWIVDKAVIKLRDHITNHETFTIKLKKALIEEIQATFAKRVMYKKKMITVESLIQRQIYKICGEFMGEKKYQPYIFKW